LAALIGIEEFRVFIPGKGLARLLEEFSAGHVYAVTCRRSQHAASGFGPLLFDGLWRLSYSSDEIGGVVPLSRSDPFGAAPRPDGGVPADVFYPDCRPGQNTRQSTQ
jgi:hypothetical protein